MAFDLALCKGSGGSLNIEIEFNMKLLHINQHFSDL